ncbi:hypothetical protein HPO96_01215 [Kribbella sandramycini]|uniref:DUF6504 domain-containing protein n=1 Tax=Kribbella sandramycini TaxID=60450 RepID=A0A7Y4NYE7_9ACTN|nr:DUF6504 family protein [Kribbella sandramycini]MBB6568558.1 hypothetical protein [Kribbella sandramycini]NOL38854.1 hypothetical protein [Kribbella sandramycini]
MWEFDEAVEVRSDVEGGVETPTQFLWRGRLWRVCSVRAHWTETAAWWERGVIGTGGASYDDRLAHWSQSFPSRAAASVHPRSRADRTAAHSPGGGAATYAPAGILDSDPLEPAAGMAGGPAAVGILDAEWGPRRAVYRVEAGCGRHGRRELFDLAHDPDSGRWQLERVTDR